MSSFSKDVKATEKKLSVGSIQSYKPLSKNASRLLEHMIDYAIDRFKTGETTHIMHFSEIIDSFGLTSTNDREYVRSKVKEIKDLDVIHWDFLGEEGKLLESVKEMARGDIDRIIQRSSFKSIVETEHFETINLKRLSLRDNGQSNTRAYRRLVDEMLDLLFPLYVGNTKIFESLDIHKSKISFSINRHLVDIFLNPNVYGVLDMSINFLFRSPYAMRLYQNACVYQHLGVTPWFSVEQSKMLFSIEKTENENGEFEFKHKQYSQFKRNVINNAIKECNKFHKEGKVHFFIELEEDTSLTSGKSVDQLRFHIKSEESNENPDISSEPVLGIYSLLDENELSVTTAELMKVVDEMVRFNVKRETALKDVEYACAKHGATFIGLMKNIEYCQGQSQKRKQTGGQPIRPGYVRKAIREGYVDYSEFSETSDAKEGHANEITKNHEKDQSKENTENIVSSKKREFVNRVFEFAQEVVENKDGDYDSLLEALSKSDHLLRQMMAMNTLNNQVIAERLLMLPSGKFRKATGLEKEFSKPELQDLL